MRRLLRWTWELPQTLIGLCLLPFYWKTLLRVIDYKDQKVYIFDKFPGGISLGYYVLVDFNRTHLDCGSGCILKMSLKNSVKHESGHGMQSRYLGPFYLILVGIPSISWNILHRISKKVQKIDYFSRYPENWADKLGNVIR